ncbi:MAG TPA: DivIVA domain-containing protein [Chryseosolibacter sp.]
MKITPLEIRQKTFEKNFRGYEKDEVHAFLLTLSQEWERLMDENKELRIKLETTEREVSKLREVESSLFKTLKTAEDTGASVIDQAKKAADLHLRESQLKADAMLNEAKSKAKDTIEESESRAKQIIGDMEDRLKTLVEQYKKLDSNREDLLSDLKRMASDLMDRVDRMKQSSKEFDADKHLNAIKREAKKLVFPNQHETDRPSREEVKSKEEPKVERVEPKIIREEPKNEQREQIVLEEASIEPEFVPTRKPQKSFFDEIN